MGEELLLSLLTNGSMLPQSPVPALARMGYGIYSLIQASKYGKTKRPEYEIPSYITGYIGSAGTELHRTPYQDLMRQLVGANYADSLRNAMYMQTSGSSLLGAATNMYGQNMRNLLNAATMDIGYRQRALQDYYRALLTGAEQQYQKWKWDKMLPYTEAMQKAAEFEKAGWMNILTGVDYLGGQAGKNLMKGLSTGTKSVFEQIKNLFSGKQTAGQDAQTFWYTPINEPSIAMPYDPYSYLTGIKISQIFG